MLRKLVLAAIGTSLLLGVWAIPASAVSDPQVLEVNAIPGTKIEICSGGTEHVNLKYGKASDWTPAAGSAETWTIRKAAPGRCKGRKLARLTYTFQGGEDYTVVYWKPKQGVKMKVFKNNTSIPTPGNATMTVRHVAQVPSVDVWIWQKVPTVAAVPDEGPTVNGLGRTKSSPLIDTLPRETMVAIFPERPTRRWNSAFGTKRLQPDRSYQVIFMGNTQKNMKVKVFALDG